MNDYFWPREMESSLDGNQKETQSTKISPMPSYPKTSKSKSENSKMTSNTFADGNLPIARQRNPFRRQDL